MRYAPNPFKSLAEQPTDTPGSRLQACLQQKQDPFALTSCTQQCYVPPDEQHAYNSTHQQTKQ